MGHPKGNKLARLTITMRVGILKSCFRPLIAIVIFLAGCSSTEDQLVSAFEESNPVASSEDAECVVDQLVEIYEADGVAAELEAESPSAQFLDDQGRSMANCGVVVNTNADLVEAFAKANPEATNGEAVCVVDALTAELGTPQLIANLWAEPTPRDFELAQFRAMFECGIDAEVRSALRTQLIDQGTPPDKAPCVADEIVNQLSSDELDVLITGESTDEFYAKFFNAMESCGAINN